MPIPIRAPQNRNNANDHSSLETLIISEQTLRDHFSRCKDVAILTATIQPDETASSALTLVFAYCEELCDTQQMRQVIFPMFHEMCRQYPCHSVDEIEANKLLPMELLGKEVLIDDLDYHLFSGDLLVYFQKADVLYSLTLANPPNRDPEEPNTEVSIRGPKDGFIEEISKNVALIRKRIKSYKLCYEQFIVGTRSQTRVGLMYIDDIANREMIHEVKKRILQLNIDSIMSTNQLEELIGDKRFSLFPLFAYTGRPDFAANSLLNGRFVILIDGAPTVIIGPGNLMFLLNTSEDNVTTPIFVVFQRLLRFMGISLAIYLPGFWTALLSFHPGEIPFTLLGTVVLSRQGVPLPVPLEMFIMVVLFEIFKEAGMRLPLAIGQTLSVVGGLIIGQSAVNAGLFTPGSLVVAAISVIAAFTLVNQNLSGTVTLLRFIVLAASSVLGLFGFIASLFFLLTYVVNLKTFGIPYLTPLSPPTMDIFKILIPNGWKIFKKRAGLVKPKDDTPRGEAN
ncbi:spore germination protein [Parageobacillus thermoglucosidasius]|uniref:Spore gernimation protein XB n=2 Tax=Anoxybacillaceae TaxID=3120669 RepID=A0AAN1D7J7_PARTM|nr:spore germination protein [Parageobacillus thermoglucosidasius]ALF11000.1 spore gernimation protein XB [Parageobacillus thermoglucosidasius]ANZ31077.1 spore gernimation protein XB [Parageobacillus thermoglucosidasius]APM81814.1 spore gernimation protein XB [Parageobacillus thermoglucosidasius]KJX67482.1 spore gernimation protein XB [Parageobacillus thermoglucosidasius]MBY6267291.1 spore germination protein [Parageobacillus thermoglucosidasius]